MITRIIGSSVIIVLLIAGCNMQSNPAAEKAAVEVAEQWVSLVDKGEYAESWTAAAQFFRGAVTEEKWVDTMTSMRKSLGKNVSRTLKSTQYMTQAPGAPDGEYVVVQFKSSFENKQSAIETITPMMDQDGKWRVSGYFMK